MLGAGGVPFSLVNAKYRVPGAQSAEVWAEALREVVRRESA
jgi:predicted DsbA family dithiol-disulfide isomerase